MKTMYANIKKALKAILANYMTAMEMYGEALNRSRGCVSRIRVPIPSCCGIN